MTIERKPSRQDSKPGSLTGYAAKRAPFWYDVSGFNLWEQRLHKYQSSIVDWNVVKVESKAWVMWSFGAGMDGNSNYKNYRMVWLLLTAFKS